MGFVSTALGFCGFGSGVAAGVIIGYYLFIYYQPSDVKDPKVRPLVELDSKSLERILPEIPLWVKSPDYDRIDWLNKFLETMWPYLNQAICSTVKESVKPIIAENSVKYNIDSVEFETFTLGSLPPSFQGMKVYATDEQELIMEPSVKWAGNPNVTVVVKAYGLKATIQVVDLQVFATPRITLKPLVSSFPCFANIFVSLMEKPHVDFGLKLLGVDLMAIPGLYRLVQETIKNQVANMYLWPRKLEVPILDPTIASKKHVGTVQVKVVAAHKLQKKDLLGKSDPFVKLKLSDEMLPPSKTEVKYKNLNPEWNEEFSFAVKDPETQYLELGVYDWDKFGRDEKMGMNVIQLRDLIPHETKILTLKLLKNMDPNDVQNEKSRGEIVLDVTYKPFKEEHLPNDASEDANIVEKDSDGTPSYGGLLLVIVHEAQDLEGKHHTNPYVKILFKGEDRKTKHIRKNKDPRWAQEFEFVCDKSPVDEKIHIEVLSKPPNKGIIYSKETLGYVDISLADVVSNKRTNQRYHLIDSKNGQIQIELVWRAS